MGIIKSINAATTWNEPVDARPANYAAAWYAVDAWLANDVAAWYVIDARLANDVAAWYVADASAAASWNGNAVDARLAHDAATRNEADASAAAAWNGNAVDARVTHDAATRNGAYAINAWVKIARTAYDVEPWNATTTDDGDVAAHDASPSDAVQHAWFARLLS